MEDEGEEDSDTIPVTVVITVYIFIITCCLVGNLTVIIVVLTRKALHTATSFFILSLCVADFLVGVGVVSLTLTHKLGVLDGDSSGISCLLGPYLELVCVTASVYSLLCVSVDRYRAIVLSKLPVKRKTLGCIFLSVWLWSCIYACKIILQDHLNDNARDEQSHHLNSTHNMVNTDDDGDNEHNPSFSKAYNVTRDTSFCSILVEEDDADLPYRIVDLFILFIVPVTAMTFIFLQIRRRLWGSNVSVTTNVRKKRSVIRFLAFDIFVFVICWLPFYCVDIVTDSLKAFYGEEEAEKIEESATYVAVRFFFIVLALSNSYINTIIYAFFNKNFINEIRNTLLGVHSSLCKTNRVSPETATTNSYRPEETGTSFP